MVGGDLGLKVIEEAETDALGLEEVREGLAAEAGGAGGAGAGAGAGALGVVIKLARERLLVGEVEKEDA